MASRLNPYLNFKGNAREAMTFYQEVFGGDLTMNTFGEYGATENADGIMHAQLVTPGGFALMGADAPDGASVDPGSNITVSLSGDDADDLRSYWEKLSSGGTVSMPME